MTDKETIYICDKGYIDYDKFVHYPNKEIYFVSRLKENTSINEIQKLPITYSNEKDGLLPKETTIVFDKRFG